MTTTVLTIIDAQTGALLSALCGALCRANTADSDTSTMPSDISAQAGCYGHIRKAIDSVLVAHGLPIPDEVNWGGHADWFADLLVAVEESIW